MAKKKVTQQEKHQEKTSQQPQDQTHHSKSMRNPSEQLESLKSLNSLLLKETMERRHQVEGLQESNKALESSLTLSQLERDRLAAELTQALEVERSVVGVFLASQFDEFVKKNAGEAERLRIEENCEIGVLKKTIGELMGELESERCVLSSVDRERDVLKHDLALQIEQANGLRLGLLEMENKEKLIQSEVLELKMSLNGLIEAKEEKERRIESLGMEKGLFEKRLENSHLVIDHLKREIHEIKSHNKQMEGERGKLEVSVIELMKELSHCNETISILRKEGDELNAKVWEMEGSNVKAMENAKHMEGKINLLVQEKKERERNVEALMDEKNLVVTKLEDSLKQLENQKQKMEEIVREKDEVQEVKVGLEGKIVELQMEEARLFKTVSMLKDLQAEQERVGKKVQDEAEYYRTFARQVKLERDDALKGLDLEKKNVMVLNTKVMEFEETINESMKMLEHMRNEHSDLIGEKDELEAHREQLLKEKERVSKQLEGEVEYYRTVVHEVTHERDNAQKGLDKEKENGMFLSSKVLELEKSIEETTKTLELVRNEYSGLIGEKKELEVHCELLMKKKISAEKSLSEAQEKIEYMRVKGKSDVLNAERVLTLLKNAAAAVCQTKDKGSGRNGTFIDEQKIDVDIQPYAAELEAIKGAFRNREMKAAEMEQQLQSLQKSVVDAHKKKSFWTLVSSATTVFAALSVAYVARGH